MEADIIPDRSLVAESSEDWEGACLGLFFPRLGIMCTQGSSAEYGEVNLTGEIGAECRQLPRLFITRNGYGHSHLYSGRQVFEARSAHLSRAEGQIQGIHGVLGLSGLIIPELAILVPQTFQPVIGLSGKRFKANTETYPASFCLFLAGVG